MNPILLIHEDGTIEQQATWTNDLYAGLEAGVVDVVRFSDGKFQYYDDEWKDI